MSFDVVYSISVQQVLYDIIQKKQFGTRILGNRLFSEEEVVQALLDSKDRLFFAESGSIHGWTYLEQRVLGGIGVAMDVHVFDDGTWYHPKIHTVPMKATLLFCPGPLLARSDCWDYNVIVQDNRIDKGMYRSVLEERILPLLLYVDQTTPSPALVTMPGLGCGMFAGLFQGLINSLFIESLQAILTENQDRLRNIALVYHYAYAPDLPELRYDEHIAEHMRLIQWRNGPSLLSSPADIDVALANAPLYKFVAWDHFSWPGNDFFANSRNTDDGVSAAATTSMEVLLPRQPGWDYRYVQDRYKFLPFKHGSVKQWSQVSPTQRLIPRQILCLS